MQAAGPKRLQIRLECMCQPFGACPLWSPRKFRDSRHFSLADYHSSVFVYSCVCSLRGLLMQVCGMSEIIYFWCLLQDITCRVCLCHCLLSHLSAARTWVSLCQNFAAFGKRLEVAFEQTVVQAWWDLCSRLPPTPHGCHPLHGYHPPLTCHPPYMSHPPPSDLSPPSMSPPSDLSPSWMSPSLTCHPLLAVVHGNGGSEVPWLFGPSLLFASFLLARSSASKGHFFQSCNCCQWRYFSDAHETLAPQQICSELKDLE